jgi:NADPH-dependent curcumin reductase CurA
VETVVNHQCRLAARPEGLPKPSDWDFTEEEISAPGDGEVVVKVRYVSLDPAMRGWMNDERSYIAPVGLGEVMRAGGAGEVIASNSDKLAVGDCVTGLMGAQRYAVVSAEAVSKVDTSVAPLPVWMNALGMPGLTAYFGLTDIGRPQEGETVLVSGAAGAVGATVGQIARLKGCRAVGIAGGPEKCRHVVDELGFDAAIDYKSDSLPKAIRQHCPEGVDIYFDNVGGETLDAALAQLTRHARVVICGAISQYNATEAIHGPSNYMSLLVNHASMTGFVIFDYLDRAGEGIKELAGWYGSGQLKAVQDIAEGAIEDFPDMLLRLFRGENLGKLILELTA